MKTTKHGYCCSLQCYKPAFASSGLAWLEIRLRRRTIRRLCFVGQNNNKDDVMDVNDVVSPVASFCVFIPPTILASSAPSQLSFVDDVLRSVCGLKEEEISADLQNDLLAYMRQQTSIFGLEEFDIVAHLLLTAIHVLHITPPTHHH